jgi:hypothetical protein
MALLPSGLELGFFSVLVSRLRAAAHALFPLAGEEKKSQVEAESHLGRRYQPHAFDAGILAL